MRKSKFRGWLRITLRMRIENFLAVVKVSCMQDRGGEPAPAQPRHGRHELPGGHEPGARGQDQPQPLGFRPGPEGDGASDLTAQGPEQVSVFSP
mgnify:CR=1 FL=1